MALLEMGANVECNGYLNGYYSTRDLIFGAEGNTWTSSNGKGELKNDCYHNGSFSIPSPANVFGYDKELLKQTILRHEAMFRDQIHELHRLYQKQREIMDELRRNELYKHDLSIEISWSGSLSCISSKNAPKVCCSPELALAAGESSVLIAESIPLPLGSVQEKSRQVCPAPSPGPTLVEGFLKDSKPSKSNYRKVGKKILDLELPAEEYIDCKEGESLEDERVSKVARVSAYTLNEISQVEHNSDENPNGANSNNFADLNEPLGLEDETAVKSGDLVVNSNTHLRDIPFHELSRRAIFGPHNLPRDAFEYPNKQDIQVFSDDPPPKQEKKHEQLSSTDIAGQSSGDLDSFAEVIDTDNISVSFELLNKKPEQVNDLPGIRSSDQINQASWGKEKNSSCQSSVGTQGSPGDGLLLGPSSAQLVFEDVGDAKSTNLNVMPAVCSERAAFQGSLVNDKENKFQDSRQELPWFKENPVPKRQLNEEESKISTQMEPVLLKHYLGGIRGFKIKKIEESDLSREKILVFPDNGKPYTSFDLHSSHASPSKVCQIQSDNQKIEEIGRDCVLDVNISCNLPDLGDRIPDGEHYMKNEIENKHKCLAGIIDLNSCLNEDEDMPIDVHFQAPESPENNECFPPRGESNEKQLEMPYRLAGQEDLEVQEHQVRIAAEALVSVSAFAVQNGPQISNPPASESFVYSLLHWFAGIVSSIKDYPENEVKVDCSGRTDNLEEFLPAGIDYFEAMTLKLTQTENLDCCCNKIGGQNEKEGGSTLLSQPGKGRATKRGRRQKDFQSEILPSLASLSRYEVTEDLQTIGGLMEAAGTHLETGSLRSAGRGFLGRGRKRSHASASNVADTLLKHLTKSTDLGIEKRDLLLSWAKACKKRRGQRYPISNPQFFLSQVYK